MQARIFKKTKTCCVGKNVKNKKNIKNVCGYAHAHDKTNTNQSIRKGILFLRKFHLFIYIIFDPSYSMILGREIPF